ncbi:ChaN family lipoprotein [Taibaiella sp. KBW10]|uniref:ChaN family lipoprotein n=1 Tax=Taibaiella sp. KBW10 TaxID=2153357 RepID=UPI0013156258|nr:ChaN family lipoprotein [Taibaiella sp. KBW10]
MRFFIHTLCLLCGLFLTCMLSAQTPEGHYKIYDTRNGQELDYATMIQELSVADAVFFGEEHNDSIGHLLEGAVLKSLYALHKDQLSLSMEMFETDVQGIMNEYLAGWISEKNFKKESRSWNNYPDYQPLVNFAKEKGIAVICANAPARYTNMVTRGTLKALDQLPKATRKAYLPPFPIDTLSGAYYDKFLETMGGHTMPNMHIYQSQNLWDATMAHNILKAMKHKKVFHLNGRFHSDSYLGTAYRVLQQKKGKVKTISCFSETVYKASEHKGLADFVILTQP